MSAAEPIKLVEPSETVAEGNQVAFADIRRREAAASPGPWFWRGNVDHSDPELSRYKPGWGRVEVLRHHSRDRTADDASAKAYDEYLRDTERRDETTGKFRSLTAEERAEKIREDWLLDQWGEPATDNRLAFVHPKHMHALDARDLAIYEVCPTATKRNDPRVYRADIIGIRHPDAEFMAHSRQDVTDLLAAVDRVIALHTLVEYTSKQSGSYWSACQACGHESDDLTTNPCPTLAALRGDA
jgi:hypothetical protein